MPHSPPTPHISGGQGLSKGELAREFSPKREGRMQNPNIQKGEVQLMHYLPTAIDPESVLQALHSQHCSVNN